MKVPYDVTDNSGCSIFFGDDWALSHCAIKEEVLDYFIDDLKFNSILASLYVYDMCVVRVACVCRELTYLPGLI